MRKETDNYIYSPAKLDSHLATGRRFGIQATEVGVETDRSKHRWLENVQRAMDIWTNVGVCVKAVSVNHNDYTEPSYTSYHVVKDAVADKLMLSRLATFMSIATQLQPYLTAFQSDKILKPFVCGELSSIVRALMKRIVKPDILDQATSTTRLLAVNYKEPANCLRLQKFAALVRNQRRGIASFSK